jgi:fructose/tagatose bisphosphate aldolase
MPKLCSSRPLLDAATPAGKAIAALNFYNAEALIAHLRAAKASKESIILQTTEATIDFPRLQEINAATPNTPLVLQTGSGVSAELLQKSIAFDIRKVNFGTELKNAFTQAIKRSLASSEDIDLRRTFAPAISAVAEISRSKIRICSSVAYERQTSNS